MERLNEIGANITDINNLPEILKSKIKHFFDHYKEIEPGKWVKTKDFLDKAAAEDAIKKSLVM